jgi:hypothetical protein
MSLLDEYLFVDDFSDDSLAELLVHSHIRRTGLGTTQVRVHVQDSGLLPREGDVSGGGCQL